MLAGFLPEHTGMKGSQEESHFVEYVNSDKQFALENIMMMPVTFQGRELKKADKTALVAFLQTFSDLKGK
ncbi:hypothetical protein QNH10_19875 [Sporosarcina thermotolerans]|nr:hypothetical protein [Sporosarcina thermotolerans]WHT48243.1 hypothetical protein QNH10_19875 [Sporosarcina thermotolerans]